MVVGHPLLWFEVGMELFVDEKDMAQALPLGAYLVGAGSSLEGDIFVWVPPFGSLAVVHVWENFIGMGSEDIR